jgi:hypothetical protein
MQIGNILTIIVSFGIGFVGTVIYFVQRTIPEKYRFGHVRAFAYFWLAMSGVWYFTGYANLIRFIGHQTPSLKYVYIAQMFLGPALVFAASYVYENLFSAKLKRAIIIVYGILCVIFWITLLKYDLIVPAETYFSGHVVTPIQTRIVFMIMFFPLWLSSIFVFIRTFIKHTQYETPLFRYFLFSSLSLIVLGISGFADEIGILSNWVVTLVRLFSLSSAFCGLISIIVLREAEEKFTI